jgi:hypothetical protein
MLSDERRLFRAALVAWIMIVVTAWLTGGPLGHDEAAYAIGAEDMLDGREQIWLYRSPGMHVLASFGIVAGGSEIALRLPAVIMAIGFLFAVRRAGNLVAPGTGAWAAAAIAGMHGLALRGHELLSDLPSTGCLVVAIAILIRELERETGPRWNVVAVAPWLAAAFYIRYASVVPIALIGVTAVALWWRRIAMRPLPIVATALALVVLAIPHAIHAITETGSPFGIVTLSAGVPRRDYVGEGLVSYVAGNPFLHYGALAAPILLFGLIAVRRASRPVRLLWTVAVGQVIVLGLLSHATPRYIYLALVLLSILGVDEIRRTFAARRRPLALAVVGLAALGTFAATVVRGTIDDWRAPIPSAAAAIRRDAAGQACNVVSRRFAQLMWYARCRGGTQEPPLGQVDGHAVYVVWLARSPGIPDRDQIPADLIDIDRDPRGRYVVARVIRP